MKLNFIAQLYWGPKNALCTLLFFPLPGDHEWRIDVDGHDWRIDVASRGWLTSGGH